MATEVTPVLEPVLSPGVRPETLTQRVREAILAAIVNQSLPSGSRVTEAELARQLNVSKTPVREALLQLREIGLIEPDERRGGRIVTTSRPSIISAYEVREALEVFAACAVARRGDPGAVEAISAMAKRSLRAARAGDLEGFRAWDEAFHRDIALASGNPRLVELIEQSRALVGVLRQRDAPGPASSVECAESHVVVAGAISRGDADAVGPAMAEHVQLVAALVLASFDRANGTDPAHGTNPGNGTDPGRRSALRPR